MADFPKKKFEKNESVFNTLAELNQLELETNILNRILHSSSLELWYRVNQMEKIDFSYLTKPLHQDIWKFIGEHVEKYKNIPSPELIEDHAPDYVYAPFERSIDIYIEELIRRFELRTHQELTLELADMTGQSKKLKGKDTIKVLEKYLSRLTISRKKQAEATYFEELRSRMEMYKELNGKNDSEKVGIKTGIGIWDELLGGIQPTDFIGILAREGQGKTTFSCKLMIEAAKQGKRCIFFSPEMSSEDVLRSMDSMEIGINYKGLNSYNIETEDFEKWEQKVTDIEKIFKDTKSKGEVYIVDDIPADSFSTNTIKARILEKESQIRNDLIEEAKANNDPKAEELYRNKKHLIDLIFIDGIHMMVPDSIDGQQSWEKWKKISNSLRSLALLERIPVISALHSNRDGGDVLIPDTKHIFASDAFGRDMTLILSLFRFADTHLTKNVGFKSVKSRHSKKFSFIYKMDLSNHEMKYVRALTDKQMVDLDKDVMGEDVNSEQFVNSDEGHEETIKDDESSK